MLKEVFIEKDQSAWWLTALDYLDRRLDTVATPDRIDDANTAQDSGAARYAELYQAIGAVYFEEDGTAIRIDSLPEAYSFNSDTLSETFAFRVGYDTVTVRTIPTADSSEAGIVVYALSDSNEEKEVCVSTRYSFYEKTLDIDISSGATKYVESRTGKYNNLEVTFLKDPKTGESVRPSRRDAAVLYCFFKEAAGDDPNWIITPLYNDVRLIKRPPNPKPNTEKVIAPHVN